MSALPGASQTNSSDYYEEDDPEFLEALGNTVLPGDLPQDEDQVEEWSSGDEVDKRHIPQVPAKRKWSDFQTEQSDSKSTTVQEEVDDDTYRASRFGGFGDYMRRKRAKLQVQNTEMAAKDSANDKKGIFKGLAIYINGWTKPSVQDLRHLIVQHGGVFQPYLDKKAIVTHIVTCSLTPAKVREFKNMKVVRPEWLVDSVKLGHLEPWKNYQYMHEQREGSQSAVSRQTTISDHKVSAPTSSKHKFISTNANFLPPKPAQVPDPLYTTDPVNKADAARIPGYAADKSNPNAQRVMANPEWRKAHTSISADFIGGYYKHSRLHHLSTWKAELKELVQEAQEHADSALNARNTAKVASELQKDGLSMRGTELVQRSPTSRWKGKAKAVEGEDRVIMHCDFDCFFVSAGLVSRPELKGKPVVVCHSQGNQGSGKSTSEIASSSYEARNFGVKNGMSLQQAKTLCPEVITIPYEFERYKKFSLQFYTVLMTHADDVEAVSVDEALIDVSMSLNEFRQQSPYVESSGDPAKDFAEMIRADVRKATTCEISIGISHNIQLARLATRRAKPGGSYHLTSDQVDKFLAPLDISDLHGFGWSTKKKAQEKLGVINLGELTKKSKSVLIDALGKATGETLYNAVRGIDDKKLESDKPRKSVSCEINYGIRFENNDQADTFIRQMAGEVQKRLEAIDMVGRSITLKIMKRDPTAPTEPPKFLGHGACDVFNKQIPLIGPGGLATRDETVIGDHAWRLLKSFNFDPKELRGIGIHIQKLEPGTSFSAQQGQAVLSFKVTHVPSVGTSKETVVPGPPGPKQPSPKPDLKDGDQVVESVPIQKSNDLPSFSQVDMKVFQSLPRDIREELEREYQRRSASPFTSGIKDPVKPPSRAPSILPPPPKKPAIFPQRPGGKGMPNLRRIAQQLAPRNRPSILPDKSALYAWAVKAKKKKKIKVSEKVLRELKLDPEVFLELPIHVQTEQLTMARILRDKGAIPEPPKERKILKPRKPVLPPDFVPYIAPKPKARHRSPPCLRQQVKGGKKLQFRETDDVQRVVETWIMTYNKWAPREKDVEFLCKYLVKCVDRQVATDVGVERAVAVMKWWLVLLRRLFPASEVMDEDDEDLSLSQRDIVGEAWWEAFRKVKERMDQIARPRFGGGLAFK